MIIALWSNKNWYGAASLDTGRHSLKIPTIHSLPMPLMHLTDFVMTIITELHPIIHAIFLNLKSGTGFNWYDAISILFFTNSSSSQALSWDQSTSSTARISMYIVWTEINIIHAFKRGNDWEKLTGIEFSSIYWDQSI
jgi:hypothetical protein